MENLNSNDFQEYLRNRVQPSMFLHSTSASEIKLWYAWGGGQNMPAIFKRLYLWFYLH